MTNTMASLDDICNYVHLNQKIKAELHARSDCTKYLAKYLFNLKFESKQSPSKVNTRETSTSPSNSRPYTNWAPMPRYNEISSHEYLATQGGNKSQLPLLSSLFRSEESFIEEYNKIIQQHLINKCTSFARGDSDNALFSKISPLNLEWFKNLKLHLKTMKLDFKCDNLLKSEVMLEDIINSWNFRSNHLVDISNVHFI